MPTREFPRSASYRSAGQANGLRQKLACDFESDLVELFSRRLILSDNGFFPQHALAPIAEALATVALLGVTGKNGAQFADDVLAFDGFLKDAIETGARFVAPEINLIFVRRFADESDLRHVGTRTT